MKDRKENYRYNTAISKIANWNCTTYVRPHYSIKPHQADNIVQRLVKNTDYINGVYFTLEDDSTIYGSGTNDTFVKNINRSIKHLHLLFDIKENVNIEKMQRKVNRRKKVDGIIKTIPQIVTGYQALRETIVSGLQLNQKAVGGVEQINNKEAVTAYVNKNMSNPQAHHNYFFKDN